MKKALLIIVSILVLALISYADQSTMQNADLSEPAEDQSVSDGDKGVCGDANDDTVITILDIIYIYYYICLSIIHILPNHLSIYSSISIYLLNIYRLHLTT